MLGVLFSSSLASAADIDKFDPRPAAIEQQGDRYIGILMSEEDFRNLLQKKIDTNAKIADCQVDQRVCKQMQDSYKNYISRLEGKLKKNNSWFDRNRGTVGIVTGLLLGTGLSVGIVHAVYQR